MRRCIHTIRIKIPIPEELNEKYKYEKFSYASPQTKLNKSGTYTDAEVYSQIDKLCKKKKVERDNDSNQKDQYILTSVNKLADYLAPKKGYKYLPLYFLKNNNIPTPYKKLSEISNTKAETRLSVTKIIPYSYCELKKMYELYQGKEMKETELMKMGSFVHRELEVNVHPQKLITLHNDKSDVVIEVDVQTENDIFQSKHLEAPVMESVPAAATDSFHFTSVKVVDMNNKLKREESNVAEVVEDEQLENLKSEIDLEESIKDRENVIVPTNVSVSTVLYTESTNLERTPPFKLNESIKRTIELLRHGRCREVPTHGYFSPVSSSLVLTPTPDSIVISGIVDDLQITSNFSGAFEQYKKELSSQLNNVTSFDDVITAIKAASCKWTDEDDSMLYILVNDDKTRSYSRKPVNAIIKTSLLQVGMYRRLLGLQSSDPSKSYISWCKNMEGRLCDVNEQLQSDIITLCCITNNLYFQDCLKLKKGETLDVGDIPFKPLEKPFVFQNSSNDPNLNVLNGEWKFSPTLAHICARLAQVQGLLNPFLHDNLQVTYLTKEQKLIAKVDGKYNEDYVNKQIDLGMQLWLGKREPAPTNTNYLCDKCDFKDICQIPLKRAGTA